MNLRNDIAEEIKQAAPYLAGLPREHPFHTPENYFAEAEESILASLSGKQTVLSIPASAIDQPFEVPASYFEELPTTILSRIREQSTAKNPVKRNAVILQLPSRRVWLAAASIAVLFFSSIMFYNYRHQQTNEYVQEHLAETIDEESSLMVNVSDINEEDIVQLLIQNDATTGTVVTSTDPSLIDVIEIDDTFLDQI